MENKKIKLSLKDITHKYDKKSDIQPQQKRTFIDLQTDRQAKQYKFFAKRNYDFRK